MLVVSALTSSRSISKSQSFRIERESRAVMSKNRMWMGRPIRELDRDELVAALEAAVDMLRSIASPPSSGRMWRSGKLIAAQ